MLLRLISLTAFTLLLLVIHTSVHAAPECTDRRQRVLLITTPSRANKLFQKQIRLLSPSSVAFRLRDLVVTNRPGRFQIELIGKDGNVAFSSREPITQRELFARIDAMPMRREEMRNQKDTGK